MCKSDQDHIPTTTFIKVQYFTPKAFFIYILEYRATSICTFYSMKNKGQDGKVGFE